MLSATQASNKMSELHFLRDMRKNYKKRIEDCYKKIKQLEIEQLELQKKCPHQVVIFYALEHAAFDKNGILLNTEYLHCPFCGRSSFELKLEEKGEIFLITQNFHAVSPKRKLEILLKNFNSFLTSLMVSDKMIDEYLSSKFQTYMVTKI